MKNTLIVDTGYLIAIATVADKWHQRAIEVSRTIEKQLITTWPVITETCHYFQKWNVPHSASRLLNHVSSNVIDIYSNTQMDAATMGKLMSQYESLPMDLADASLLVLAEYLGHGNILSTDLRDFNAYRWKNTHPFNNLLLGNQ